MSKVKLKAQACTCPHQKEKEHCHPECQMLKAIKDNGGEIEEVKEKIDEQERPHR